jgi:hypothetical protein
MRVCDRSMRKKTLKLEDMEVTNGEIGTIDRIVHFLKFMRAESAPLPVTPEELEPLLVRYIKQIRREDMAYVSALRVSRGESPLPARMLR